jgi:ATP dependent DNA ligase domain
VGLRILPAGSLDISRFKAPFSMARLPASMSLAGQCFAIYFSGVVSAYSSLLTCCISTAKTCGYCRSFERKAVLKRLLRRKRSRILYLDHVERDGRQLFEQIVRMDLEGTVCKQKNSPYKVTEKPSRCWIKVKNSRYSQLEGREELLEAATVRNIHRSFRPTTIPESPYIVLTRLQRAATIALL